MRQLLDAVGALYARRRRLIGRFNLELEESAHKNQEPSTGAPGCERPSVSVALGARLV